MIYERLDKTLVNLDHFYEFLIKPYDDKFAIVGILPVGKEIVISLFLYESAAKMVLSTFYRDNRI